MRDKLKGIEDKYRHLELQLADPDVISDMDRWSRINKEYKSLEEIVHTFRSYESILDNLKDARGMLNDPEMKEMAEEEIGQLEPQKEKLEERLRYLLIPKDPEDEKDVIVEIRAGTGGDEAAIFAGDLYRMYDKYFEEQGWKTELISQNEGTVGGFKEIVVEVRGKDVYGQLKFESGAHRVQRVPKTESQGRVHTSAATVAVIPKMELEDLDIKKEDVNVDVYRASGAGGQHVNRTESAVRMTHLPTGIVAESQDSRSQIKNREIAMQRLIQKIQEVRQAEHASSQAAQRRSLVGSGDRSEKIRTYNYPQNRVTDHRLEGDQKNYNLSQIIEGDLSPVIEALQMMENTRKMQAEVS